MKFKSIFTLLLTLSILLSAVGCGASTTASDTAAANDDFFGIDENTISNSESQADDADDVKVNSNNSAINNSSSNNSNKNSSTSNNSSGKNNNNEKSGKSWDEVRSSMPKSLRGTTLKIWNWNPTSEYLGASAVIEKFEKQTGITVKWQTVNFDQYQAQLTAVVASGDVPDLARTRTTNPVILQNFQPLSVSGYDFTDAAWDQAALEDYSYNGKAFAATLNNTHLGTVNILLYNSALIDQYDLEDPYQLWKNNKWTWDKFIDICRKYKKAANAEFATSSFSMEPWFNIHGMLGPVELQNGKFVNISCTTKFVNLAQKMAQLSVEEGLIVASSSEAFEKGDALFFGDGAIFARSKNAYFGTLKEEGTLNAVPFPAVDGQDKYYVGSGEYEAYGIVKGAKNAQAAPYFLRYFLDSKNYDMSIFFNNAQILEVYNWSMKQKNRVASVSFSPLNGEEYDQDWAQKFYKTPSGQMKTFLESNSSIIDTRVNNMNKAIGKLK